MTEPQAVKSGANPPVPDSEGFGIRPEVTNVLLNAGIRVFQPIQYEALKAGIIPGNSVLVCSPSGSGKTLIGELVCLHRVLEGKRAFLLVPLRALANEQYVKLRTRYHHLPFKIGISTGDYQKEGAELEQYDLIILTYERFDWLLRTEPDWLTELGAVVIDEIHVLNDMRRGPRLESAIVRLRQKYPATQVVGLSATIANPEELAEWLGCQLVHSQRRPVELLHRVLIAPDAKQTIGQLVRATVRKSGQVLVFTPTRREAERMSHVLASIIVPFLTAKEHKHLEEQSATMLVEEEVPSIRERLAERITQGVAFHHAGLDMTSRGLVESLFRKRFIKVVCCTPTLGAGINTPARVVILQQPLFLKQVDQKPTYHFTPPNRVHQILGRAGRPGQEDLGFAIILAANPEEAEMITRTYFTKQGGRIVPKYDPVRSRLFAPALLQEQVLILAAQKEGTSPMEIHDFFERSYWWFQQQKQRPKQSLDKLVRIGSMDIEALIGRSSELVDQPVEITVLGKDKIEGRVGEQTCRFSSQGPICSCSATQRSHQKLCRHLQALAQHTLKSHPQYAQEIIPRSLKEEFILDFLERRGLVVQRADRFYATDFGQLIVRLYLRPATGMWIRSRVAGIKTSASFVDTVSEALRYERDQAAQEGLSRSLQKLSGDQKTTMIAAAQAGRLEIGDLESLMHTVIWLANAVSSIAQLDGHETTALIGEPVIADWETLL
ncbi:MAG: DEAD/DEAH box helicase [Promethearchaeota archaeon]